MRMLALFSLVMVCHIVVTMEPKQTAAQIPKVLITKINNMVTEQLLETSLQHQIVLDARIKLKQTPGDTNLKTQLHEKRNKLKNLLERNLRIEEKVAAVFFANDLELKTPYEKRIAKYKEELAHWNDLS